MKQIGFINFRKFKEFPPMDLAPITIFVGENNAGKSTVVKGILALSDFLNETNKNSFRFVPIEEILDGKKFIFQSLYTPKNGISVKKDKGLTARNSGKGKAYPKSNFQSQLNLS